MEEEDLVTTLIGIRKAVEDGRLPLDKVVQVTAGWLMMLALDHGYEPEELIGLMSKLALHGALCATKSPRLKLVRGEDP